MTYRPWRSTGHPWIGSERVGRGMLPGAMVLACCAGLALGQGVPGVPGTPPDKPGTAAPLDVNQPGAKRASEASPEAAASGGTYHITRFELRYHDEQADQPPVGDVGEARVKLGVAENGNFTAYRPGLASVTIRVADVIEGASARFDHGAVLAVAQGLVEEYYRRGYRGVMVQPDPEDIDEAGKDLRTRDRSALRMVVWMGRVGRVVSFASGPRLGAESATEDQVAARYDSPDRVHRRIRGQSPIQKGDLLRADQVDEFVARLNRHPGRQVRADMAPLAGPENAELAELTYRIYEAKPWSVYGQVSNTGTKQTNEWRERLGFVHNQLTAHDDVLRADYVTGGFDQTHALTGSYEFPLLSDRIRTRLYGSYSKFDASQVGLAGEKFSGETWQGGGEVSWLVLQHRDWFLDAQGGLRWESVRVEDTLLGSRGNGAFVIPYLGARVERSTAASSTSGGVSLETNLSSLSQGTLDSLGRLDCSAHWVALKYDAQHSMYLTPTLGVGHSLAQEVVARVRGQFSFGSRLIANEQDVVGGMYTVRGYPESASAGDSTMVGSLEYRFHIPRAFTVTDPGQIRSHKMTTMWPFGEGFRWAPQEPLGTTDWDWVVKGFLDVGRTSKAKALTGENGQTLAGAGVGMELSLRSNASLSVDWGFALKDTDEPGNSVKAGSSRLHFVLTLLY